MKFVRILSSLFVIALVSGIISCQTTPTSESLQEASNSSEQVKVEPSTSPVSGPQIGNSAPDFMFKDADGQDISLKDLHGKVVVLNFWATWCGPCKAELSFIQQISHDKELLDMGMVFLTINEGESMDEVGRFMIERGLSFNVLLDTKNVIGRLYNVRFIPTTFFIDRDGIIQDVKSGAFTSKAEIEQKVRDLM